MAAEFYAPMPYSPVWLYIGVIIVMAILGWAVVIWAQTRPGRTPREPELPPGWRMARLKGDYIDRIDEIVRGIYPVEFGPDRHTSVFQAATYARQVVAQWT